MLSSDDKGMNVLLNFWKKNYLQEYIPYGGSKIKFVTGRKGSGKTYFLNAFQKQAEELGYITVNFSAKHIWLNDFREIYLEILRQADIENRLHECADQIIRQMGDDPARVPEGRTYIDWLASQDRATILNKKQIRDELSQMFLNNPHLDHNFAIACSIMTAGFLGHPSLDEQSKEIYLGWLKGDKTIKLATFRAAGLIPTRITKYNARHMLRSLAEVIHIGGHPGLVVTVDDLDVLQDKSGLEDVHYASVRREDTYESIRQLIDEIDTMHYIMFVYGFDRALIDNEKAGLKSYQALWMRVQNEVVSQRFNCFSDIADLDQMASQMYSAEYLVEMSRSFSEHASRNAGVINAEQANEILQKSQYGTTGIAELVRNITLGKGDDTHE